MNFWKVQIVILLVVALMLNPFSIEYLCAHKILGNYFSLDQYGFRLLRAFISVVNVWMVSAILHILCRRNGIITLCKNSYIFNFYSGLLLFLAMLAANPIYAGKLQWLRIAFPILTLLLFSHSFWLAIVKSPHENPEWRKNLATFSYFLIATFLLVEIGFMFVARSHQFDGTLASKIWFARNWKLNSQGIRERELAPKPESKKVLFLSGDSFVAGHGIADPNHRFSSKVQSALSADWEVYNLGVNGFGTSDELEQLKKLPLKPDQVILFWYLNDIEACSWRILPSKSSPNNSPTAISLIHGSYLINYLWWSFPHNDMEGDYLSFLKESFTNQEVRQCHFSELEEFSNYCFQNQIEFKLVSFPLMSDINRGDFAMEFIRSFVQSEANKNHKIPFLDLSIALEKFSTQNLVVNNFDAHPNEFSNELIGNSLISFLNSIKSDSLE